MTAWPTVQLREVADIAAGITLGRKTNDPELKDVPYMRVANVKDGVLDVSDMKTVAATAREIEKWTLRDGDLLLTEGGDLDKLGRGACWRNQLPLCIHQNHIFRVRLPGDRYDPDFVSYQVGSPYGKAYFFAHAKKTTGIASINQGVLGAFPLLSPPREEQRRIAARLKAQLAEVETARQAAQAQACDAGLLRRRLLEAAFGQVLSRFDRDVCLADVCSVSAGGTPSRGNAAYFNGHIPWVKTLDLNFGVVMDTEEKVSQEAFRAIRGELLPIGTVLVAMYGGAGTIGKSGVLGIEACTNQAVCALQPKAETLDSEFLHEWLCFVRPEWMRLAGGNRKDPNINKSVVENMTLPLPPLDEQRRIVTRLKAQLAEADAIAQAAAAQLADIDKLPQQLLARAFRTTPGGTP